MTRFNYKDWLEDQIYYKLGEFELDLHHKGILKGAKDLGHLSESDFNTIINNQKDIFFNAYRVTLISYIIKFLKRLENCTDIIRFIALESDEVTQIIQKDSKIEKKLIISQFRTMDILGSSYNKVNNSVINFDRWKVDESHILLSEQVKVQAFISYREWLKSLSNKPNLIYLLTKNNPREALINQLNLMKTIEDRLDYWLKLTAEIDLKEHIKDLFGQNEREILDSRDRILYQFFCIHKNDEVPTNAFILGCSTHAIHECTVSIDIPYSIWKECFEKLAFEDQSDWKFSINYGRWLLSYKADSYYQYIKNEFDHLFEHAENKTYAITHELDQIKEFEEKAKQEALRYKDNQYQYSNHFYWLHHIYLSGQYIDKLSFNADYSELIPVVARYIIFKEYLQKLQNDYSLKSDNNSSQSQNQKSFKWIKTPELKELFLNSIKILFNNPDKENLLKIFNNVELDYIKKEVFNRPNNQLKYLIDKLAIKRFIANKKNWKISEAVFLNEEGKQMTSLRQAQPPKDTSEIDRILDSLTSN
jgi:hypothetical protein